jgi:hypothetical protein
MYADTAVLVNPVNGEGVPSTVVPYVASRPYSNETVDENPLGFTNPFSTAVIPEMDVAGLVEARGAPLGTMLTVKSEQFP